MTEIIKEKLKTIKGFGTITKLEISSLITTIESQDKALEISTKRLMNIAEEKNVIIESQKEEIEKLHEIIEKEDNVRMRNIQIAKDIESQKAITELAVKTLNDVVNEDFSFPPGRSEFIRERLLEIKRLGGEIT